VRPRIAVPCSVFRVPCSTNVSPLVALECPLVSLTFIVGNAADVFAGDLARAVDAGLRERFPLGAREAEAYRSEPVEPKGWRVLQQRVLRTLDLAPQLTTIDAYQSVFVPAEHPNVEHMPIANLADPLQVGSLPRLLEELRRFAGQTSLPTDDVELMQLAAQYLESDDLEADLDVQTYVQLMLSAKQALVRGQALWVVA
jgi:hypothetical protein